MKGLILLATGLIVCGAAFGQKPPARATRNNANRNVAEGFIRDARNHPLADVQAFVYNPDSSIAASGYTDAKGFFETNAVAPGKYDLKIIYPSGKITMVTGVVIKHGMAMVNITMNEPSADTSIASADIMPKPAEKKKAAHSAKKM
jgi:hypothetical protein